MVRRFFNQSFLEFKAITAAFKFEEFMFFETAYPLMTLIFYVLLAGYSFNTTDLTHWVVGNSFLYVEPQDTNDETELSAEAPFVTLE